LIFKWNEADIPVSQILALTPERPLVGNRCGKNAQSHWLVFLKCAAPHQPVAPERRPVPGTKEYDETELMHEASDAMRTTPTSFSAERRVSASRRGSLNRIESQ